MSKLTDASIRKMPFTKANQYTKWDEMPSFGVRVGRRSKTFVLKKDNKYHCLGRWPVVSLKKARDEAKRRLALKYFPQSSPAVKPAIEEYLQHQEARLRHGSLIQFRHHLYKHFPQSGTIGTITLPVLRTAIKDLTPSQANHFFSIAKAFLNWCVDRQYLAANPLQRAKQPHKDKSRDRVLSDDEIRSILLATSENTPFNNIIQFLIYSAQRRTQVARLRRTFVDYIDNHITWPKEEMKANQPHSIPLTDKLRALIDRAPDGPYAFSATPFQAWSLAKKQLDERVKLPHWVIHDLRRTARTNLARYRISENVAERILAHAPPKMNSIYNKYLYLPPMHDALLKLEEHYTNLLRS